MQTENLYEIFKQYPVISTDTRYIKENSIFFALKGANFNGNQFADEALKYGAKYVVVDESDYVRGEHYLLVDDVLTALQDLAKYHRQQLQIPIVGITGTNGKTTSKELLYAVLSQKFKTYATQGNLNNHIGVPLTLLSIDSTYEMAVIEMGANHIGEIALLSNIAQPDCGLITNVGKAHLEGFGSFEGVKKTKGELYDYLQANNGTLFIQGDNQHLIEMASSRTFERTLSYGFTDLNEIIGKLIVADPYLSIKWRQKDNSAEHVVKTHLTGSYNMENILAAVSVGLFFDLSPQQINTGIENYVPKNNRSQITKTEKNTIVADFYNANASSMVAALENMSVISADNKVVILGDMFELGEESYKEHQKLVNNALASNFDRLIFVGKEFYKHKSDQAQFFPTTADAEQEVGSIKDSFILLKASRGMAFEKLLAVL